MGYTAWILGSILGTTSVPFCPNPESFGLTLPLVAMFIGIFSSSVYNHAATGQDKEALFRLGRGGLPTYS